MPKLSTRNKLDVTPTRAQPKRACRRSADPTDPSSLPPSKRIRTETVIDNTEKKSIDRSKRTLPATKDTSCHTREHQPTTKAKTNRKRAAFRNDLDDDESRPANTKPTKRRRLDQLVDKAPSPIPDTKTSSWHLPIELLCYIYDYLWDHEHVECYWMTFHKRSILVLDF